MAILAAGVLTATSFNPVMIKAESVSAEEAGMAVPADAAGMSVPADAAGAAVSADEAGAAVSADEAGVVVAGDGSETAVFSEDGTPVKKTVKSADINRGAGFLRFPIPWLKGSPSGRTEETDRKLRYAYDHRGRME